MASVSTTFIYTLLCLCPYVCVRTSALMTLCACGGQRTAMHVVFNFHLGGWGFLYCSLWCRPGWMAMSFWGYSVSVSHVMVSRLGFQRWTGVFGFMCAVGI